MYAAPELQEYLSEIREQVCSRCMDRPPGGPPCAPKGKRCGIELHLAEIVEICRKTHSRSMEPYCERFHQDVCSHCVFQTTSHCPCPLEPLLQLAVEAIETVDERAGGKSHDVACNAPLNSPV